MDLFLWARKIIARVAPPDRYSINIEPGKGKTGAEVA